MPATVAQTYTTGLGLPGENELPTDIEHGDDQYGGSTAGNDHDHALIHKNVDEILQWITTFLGLPLAVNVVTLTGNQTVAGIKTLSSAPIFSSLTGYLKGNGASALTAAATIPEADVSPDGSIYVRKTTAQTITGAKTFDSGALLDKGNIVQAVAAHGGVADGATDNAAAIAAAIAAMPASGGCLYFGPGDWRFGSAISTAKSVWILGAGRAVTLIKCTFATGDAITISGASAVVEKVSLQSTVNRTSGAILKITGGCTLDQMNVENNFFTGLHLAGTGYLLRNCYVGAPGSASGSTGILISQGTGIAITDDTVVTMAGGHATRYALRLDGCGDIAISDSHFLSAAYGLYAAPTTDGVYSIFAVNSHFDGNTTRGVLLKPGAGGVIRRVQFVNCASTSNGGTGFEIDNNGGTFTGSVELVGHRSYGNTGDGLLLTKTSGALPVVNVVGGTYTDPTIPNSGVDIHISAGVTNFHLSDFIADDVTVETGASDNYTIEPRALTTLTDGGSGTAKRIYLPATARLGFGASPGAALHLGGTNVLRFGNTASDEMYNIYRFGDGILYFDGEQASFAGFKFRTDQGGVLTNVLAIDVNGAITIPNLTASRYVTTNGSKVLTSQAGVPEDDVTADGTTFVALTGNQTVAGIKTLSSAPILSALTASQYVKTDGSKALASQSGIPHGDVTFSGLTATHVWKASGASAASFAALADTDLPAHGAAQHTNISRRIDLPGRIWSSTGEAAITFAMRGSSANVYDRMYGWDFPGTGGPYSVAVNVNMPLDWDGGSITMTMRIAPATVVGGNAVIQVLATYVELASQIDQALETDDQNAVIAVGSTAENLLEGSTAAFTPAGSHLRLVVRRAPDAFAADTSGDTVWFTDAFITYTATQ